MLSVRAVIYLAVSFYCGPLLYLVFGALTCALHASSLPLPACLPLGLLLLSPLFLLSPSSLPPFSLRFFFALRASALSLASSHSRLIDYPNRSSCVRLKKKKKKQKKKNDSKKKTKKTRQRGQHGEGRGKRTRLAPTLVFERGSPNRIC